MNLEISGNGKILQEELKLDNKCSFTSSIIISSTSFETSNVFP